LTAHCSPLKVSDDDGTQTEKGYSASQANHPSFCTINAIRYRTYVGLQVAVIHVFRRRRPVEGRTAMTVSCWFMMASTLR
jgi:hypothetical protein